MKNFILLILLIVLLISTVLAINAYIYINNSPQFGAPVAERDTNAYRNSDNFDKGVFLNQVPTAEALSVERAYQIIKEFILNQTNTSPDRPIKPVLITGDELRASNPNNETQLVWFGHSTFLLQTDGMNLLFDPMLGDVPAPHPWLAGSRYSKDLPIEIAELPTIDAVLITHDHYDHLDYHSIQQLDQRVGHYFAPLGVGAHLEEWGVDASRITELDWWDTATLANTEFTFTPARHFSGRSYNDYNSTLWGGWVMKNDQHTIYFTGDTGYGPQFKEVGKRFDSIDLALIENGQYNEHWNTIHLMPEEAIRAGIEANAKAIMPVHWGAFTLSIHEWDEPIERALIEAKKQNIRLTIPQIGEIVRLNDLPEPDGWWRQY